MNIRGLTLLRPWPWAFTHAGKRVENRTWRPFDDLVGGFIALHAGLGFDRDAESEMMEGCFGPVAENVPPEHKHPSGVIVAVARLEGWWLRDSLPGRKDPWAFGPVCWRLPRVQVLEEPVVHRGAQGLWRVSPAAQEAIEAQVDLAA